MMVIDIIIKHMPWNDQSWINLNKSRYIMKPKLVNITATVDGSGWVSEWSECELKVSNQYSHSQCIW